MKTMTRREICAALPAMAVIRSTKVDAQTPSPTSTAQTIPAMPASTILSQPRVFTLDQMPSRKMANGGESRDVLRGTLPTGEIVAVHESDQPAGTPPNPPHVIQHSEIITVLQGTVVFEYNGQSDKVGPGSVILVPPGTLHQLRNVGTDTAKYCVVQIGGDTKK
jgi:mannose-6-phosphate isomerase-like protein (cupin superfamily)